MIVIYFIIIIIYINNNEVNIIDNINLIYELNLIPFSLKRKNIFNFLKKYLKRILFFYVSSSMSVNIIGLLDLNITDLGNIENKVPEWKYKKLEKEPFGYGTYFKYDENIDKNIDEENKEKAKLELYSSSNSNISNSDEILSEDNNSNGSNNDLNNSSNSKISNSDEILSEINGRSTPINYKNNEISSSSSSILSNKSSFFDEVIEDITKD